ncbi:hypothetical protein C1886_10785 [Pseudomonas sp. FW300-N1A1]|uniref:hypothetical protein n=1 Tax=Pseudomonas sp. FW300-N1A1 TaxID=2075555 RepID=UPI000CCFE5F6|nr:hypothetical protein [Pseudomonas sp. FW300-N1A1]POA19972.1 hypothetical protein C1886_10785 [Pseudomonas sp. FW300-N1A1]
MQWGLIFEDAAVVPLFQRLDGKQKVLVLAAYIYRQIRLIKDFDRCYGERLSDLLVKALTSAVLDGKDVIRHVKDEVLGSIPDTDEFAEQEGAYAQNIMIALDYFLLYMLGGDISDMQRSVDMALQNIDLLYYEMDEGYDEKKVVEQEVLVVLSIIKMVSKIPQGLYSDIRSVQELSRKYML